MKPEFLRKRRWKTMLIWLTSILLLCGLPKLNATQTLQVTGAVTDAKDNTTLIGVNVTIKGTNVGTITDINGKYRIDSPTTDAVLVFSFVGYKTTEIPVNGQSVINVTLSPENKILDEVVITALGIQKDKAKVGYAIQDIKGEELIKAREPNPVNSLTGKFAGLTVGASAELLGSPSVFLRGKTPIFVVDGVPIQSDTWNISPDDIESYTVLKGPAASALYGSRGQYGAIMITTKRGSKDKRGFAVEFNSSSMLESGFIAIPKVQDEYGPGDHGVYAFGDGRGAGLNDGDYDIWGPKFEGQLIPQYDSPVIPGQTFTTTFPNGTTYTSNRKPTPYIARGKDNLKRFLENGLLSTNNLTVSSSNEKYDLRFSATHTYQKGIVPNTQLNSTNFNVSAGYNFSKKLRFESNVNFNRQFTPNIPDVEYGPNSIIYNIILWGGADWDIDDMKNYWQEGKEGIQSIYAEYQRYHNPYFMSHEWLRGHYKTDLYGYTSLKWTIANYLNLTARTQVNTYDLLRTEKLPYSAHPYGREAGKGDYREDKRTMFENNTDLLLTFDKNLLPEFNVKASLGGNIRTYNYRSSFASTDYLNVPGWYNLNNSLNPRKAYNYYAPMQVLSSYGYVDLSYKNAYNLSFTGRVDKNSTLPVENNTYFYPSVSGSIVITELVKLPSVSYLKVRGSYANVGSALTSSTIGPTFLIMGDDFMGYGADYYSAYEGPSFANSASYNIIFPYNNQPAASYTNTIPNPGLEPSFSSAWEVGTDFRVLKNRVGFDVTYFRSLDGPGIFRLPVSSGAGYDNALVNGIKTERTGWEVSSLITPMRNAGGFNWDILVNWSTFKEVLKEIYPGVEKYNTYLKVGDRMDKIYGSAFVRTQDGDLILDGSGRTFNNPVRQFLGYANPDWSWSFRNNLSYKGISFAFQFDGRVGGKIVNHVQRQTFRGGRHIETVEGKMGEARYQDYQGVKSWLVDGKVISNGAKINYDADGNIINYDQLQYADNTTKTYLQDYISRYYNSDEGNLMSRSFAKLREVTISYNLPSKILGNSFIKQASISLVGRNLLYFAEKKDIDLDQYAGSNSTSNMQTPTMRRYGINLNITF